MTTTDTRELWNRVEHFPLAIAGTAATSLSELMNGHDTLLVFCYPKDATPGCTTEVQNFRDHYADFSVLNCAVVGVSRDSIKRHQAFIDAQQLPFPLISDPDETLCLALDVMKEKIMYGKQVRGVERSSFLWSRDGKLLAEWRKVKPATHTQEVLAYLRALTNRDAV